VRRGETSNQNSFVGLKCSSKTWKRPVQLRGMICDKHLLSFVSSLSSSPTPAAFQCFTANKINFRVHTAWYLSCLANRDGCDPFLDSASAFAMALYTHWLLHLRLVSSTPSELCTSDSGETLKSLGFSHLNWVLDNAPIFRKSRRSLMDSEVRSNLSSDLFNRHIWLSCGSASTRTMLNDLKEVLLNVTVEI